MVELSGVQIVFFDDEMQVIEEAKASILLLAGGRVDLNLPPAPQHAIWYQVYVQMQVNGLTDPITLISAVHNVARKELL